MFRSVNGAHALTRPGLEGVLFPSGQRRVGAHLDGLCAHISGALGPRRVFDLGWVPGVGLGRGCTTEIAPGIPFWRPILFWAEPAEEQVGACIARTPRTAAAAG